MRVWSTAEGLGSLAAVLRIHGEATTCIDQTKISTGQAQEDQHGLPLFIFATSSYTSILATSASDKVLADEQRWSVLERSSGVANL